MSIRRLSFASSLAILAAMVLPLLTATTVRAQNAVKPTVLFQVSLDDAVVAPAPISVRLLRITMQPGSSSPNHTHPGPELWRVESGTVTVRVQGPTILLRAKSGSKPESADLNKDVELTKGDQITFLPGTPLFFANKSDAEVKLLVSVIFPAGHQRPPLISYVDGQPADNAFAGIRSDILGDGRADIVPTGSTTITIDRLDLTAGQAIPAEQSPLLVSVAKGSLVFNLASGRGQVTRTATPALPETDSPDGQSYELAKGDAIFFPAGMAEAERAQTLADVSLYRVIISGDAAPATPVSQDQVAVIEVTGPQAPPATPTVEVSPTAAATEASTQAATAQATEVPTKEATKKPTRTPTATAEATGKFQVGQTVYVSDTDVRLRDAPTTNSNIVTGLTIGQALVITGESQVGDDITWWPVQSPDDETLTGWVAEQFLSAEPPQ